MQVVKSLNNLGKNFGSFLESEDFPLLFGLEVEQISSVAVLADEVLEILILLCVEKLHDVRRVEILHTFNFAFQIIQQIRLFK